MRTNCRVIIDKPHSAAFNMAADLYLLSVCASEPAIYLRFYTWEKPSISLGCMQNPETLLDKEAMTKAGAEWVKRPTGGRAVLHCEDITYSCVFSNKIAEMGSTIDKTYTIISNCLINGLAFSGIHCMTHDYCIDTKQIQRETKLPCYLAPNRNEIMVNGKKLVGSAQKRTADAVLQHGSIPLTGKFRDLPLYQRSSKKEKDIYIKLLKKKCICIEECLKVSKENDIVRNLIKGFKEVLPFQSETGGWKRDEEKSIQKIVTSDEFLVNWKK